MLNPLLPILPAVATNLAVGAVWFFLAVLTMAITSFRWIPAHAPWSAPGEFLFLTLPHTLVGGTALAAVLAFAAPRWAPVAASAPLVHAGLIAAGIAVALLR